MYQTCSLLPWHVDNMLLVMLVVYSHLLIEHVLNGVHIKSGLANPIL